MRLSKPIAAHRSKSHVNTRLELRDERAYSTRLIPWLALVNVAFGFVDWLISPAEGPLLFFGVRVLAVLVSWALFQLTRARVRHGTRLLCTVGPYILGVEYIMIRQGLTFSPYFAGLALVVITSTMLFPVRARVAAEVYTASLLPILVWAAFLAEGSLVDRANVILMGLGTVVVCAVNSGQVYQDLRARLSASESLTRHLGRREAEVRRKAEQLLKRQAFESQFSPQVVKAVLEDPYAMRGRALRELVVIVIDVENSTGKATTLPVDRYDEVVEEVYDVFASACLKWNITVDKFTGDGGMAFAGAPVRQPDDFRRALMACKETLQMLSARSDMLGAKWGEPLNVRISMAEGLARVGFIGRGTLKAYTAVGESVSLTHRLASVPSPWAIAAYSSSHPEKLEEMYPGVTGRTERVTGLKGFGERSFMVRIFQPALQQAYTDAGRCPSCETPLVFEEDKMGLPKVVCPGCRTRAVLRAA